MTKAMTFKQLVTAISNIKTEDDLNKACAEIDRSFDAEKITWNDHTALYKIIRMLDVH